MKLDILIKSYKDITEELLSLQIEDDTDELLDQINSLLDKREKVVDQIAIYDQKIDEDELNSIAAKDFQLKAKFEEIKLRIASELENISKEKKQSSVKKKAHRGYMNLGHQVDGYFIDKKK